jgi:phosphoglycerate dehydrogenase-like enzyme
MFIEKISDADVCITGWGCPKFEEDILKNAARLKLIAHTGGTVANLVSDCMYEKGIRIISGNWLFAESVAEGVIAYILCSLRDLIFHNNHVHSGGWESKSYNEGLLDQTIGLVGFGMVAKYLVGMLKPFRAKIKVYDPYITDETCKEYGVESTTLDEVVSGSEIISIHAPKIPETYHMIDKRLLEMIPDGALLVNTARGAIIDEEAMAMELRKNRFKAVLDVYEKEPLPKESKLRGLSNVILIPHMAGPTVDRRKNVTLALLEEIENFFTGKTLRYEINKEYAMKMTYE